jgi:four helix bundle protein
MQRCARNLQPKATDLRAESVEKSTAPNQIQLNPAGTGSAAVCLVAGWKNVEEVVAYQLAIELRDRILKLTKSGTLSKDWKFCNQIRDSARSAPQNLSEGFYRYNHGEFAQFTNIAKSSLAETKNHLEDGKRRATSPRRISTIFTRERVERSRYQPA